MNPSHKTIDPQTTVRPIDHSTFSVQWNLFWFEPSSVRLVSQLRGLLCLVTACYFLSSLTDVATWYGSDGVLSRTQVADWSSSQSESGELRWRMSPLFLTDHLMVFRGWAIIGVVLCVAVAIGRGGRWASIAVWLTLIGWANRSLFVAGIAEPLLSLSWLAASIAPASTAITANGLFARPFFAVTDPRGLDRHWTATLSARLLAVQGTIIGLATFSTMMAGRVWWNGLGSYALAAPTQDRYFHAANWISPMMIHEPLTHLLLWILPLGLFLAWQPRYETIGRVLLVSWTIAIAVLTSHFLYASTLGIMFLAIRRNLDSTPSLSDSCTE